MSKYDIVITLFTIIYGLMLTVLFSSFHRLIRCGKAIKWHWLPVLAAWYLFLVILKNWWDLTFWGNGTDWMNIYYFIAYGHLLLLLFLLVSTALPDDIQQSRINLKEHYFKNHRYFWGLMSSVFLLSFSIGMVKQLFLKDSFNVSHIFGYAIFLILTIILAATKRYWVHSFVLLFLVIQVIFEILHE